MFFLDSRFLLYEYRHKLTEELAHDIHTLLASLHVIESMAHSEEHRLHSSSVRCCVELRVTLGDVTDTNKVGSGLKVVKVALQAPLEKRLRLRMDIPGRSVILCLYMNRIRM